MKKLYILLSILLSTGVLLNAQNVKLKTDSVSPNTKVIVKYPRLHWGFYGGGGTFSYMFDKAEFTNSNKTSFTGGVFLELKFLSWIGLEAGGAYTVLQSNLALADYSKVYTGLKDDQGDNVDLTIKANKVETALKSSFLEIPVSLRFEWNPGRWTLYLKPGVSYTMVQSSTYSQNGYYTRNGFYPDYGVTFDNLSQHGFYSNRFHSQADTKLELKNSINPFIGFGIILPGTAGRFFVEGKYYPGSINFSKSSSDIKPFDASGYTSIPNNYYYSSPTSLSNKIGFGGFMIQVGFRFR
jgi:hypothetical protein